ncbi:MAG: cysteine desulfurase, partial [Thermoleophilia bacterium]|nr:cysteine desulfurase [Thermoleophilia bacterium]
MYLDHAATTPIAPGVLTAMTDALAGTFGNPANTSHAAGRAAVDALVDARGQVASLIGAAPERVFFTSGATEANNLAIRGLVERARVARPGHVPVVLVSAIEHRSVLCPVDALETRGVIDVRRIPVTGDGVLDLAELDRLLELDPLLVCVHLANNEIGTIQPIRELVARAHARGTLVLCDATQAVGKVDVTVEELGIDLLSLSAHKFHGPKGAGALYVAPGVSVEPQVTGGGQECGLRAGTPNVPAIVGMGVAAEEAGLALAAGEGDRVAALRERLETALLELAPCAVVNGVAAPRLPGIVSITFPGSCGGELVEELRELQVSRGSACSTGSPKPSHVL